MLTLNKKRKYIICSLLGIITITLATISTINRVKKISTPPEVYELSKGDNNVDNYLEWEQLIKKHVANELYINVNGFWIDMEKNNIFSGSISCFAKKEITEYLFNFDDNKFSLSVYKNELDFMNETYRNFYIPFNYIFTPLKFGASKIDNKFTVFSEYRQYLTYSKERQTECYFYIDNELIDFDEQLIKKQKYFILKFYKYVTNGSIGDSLVEIYCEI